MLNYNSPINETKNYSELEISEGEDRVKIVRSNKKQSATNNNQREIAKDDFKMDINRYIKTKNRN